VKKWYIILGVVLSMTFAACTPAATPPVQEVGPETGAVAGQPVQGGSLRVETGEIIDDVDPHTAWSHVEWSISGRLLFEGLMELNREGELAPRLAEDWPEISEDGRVYTFRIRQGVKWHNGREVVAADFKYGMERATDPDTGSWGQSYLQQVAGYQDFIDKRVDEMSGIRVIDDYTLEITLQNPQALFLTLLISTSTFPLPQEEVEQWGNQWGTEVAIGNGPYMVSEWIPDQRLVLVRNPDYWEPGRPYLDEQVFTMAIEPSVSLLKLARGDIDMMTSNASPDILQTAQSNPEWAEFVQSKPSMTSLWMFMNMEVEPFDNQQVRQAINHTIDRDALIRVAGGGTPLFGVYPPGMPAYAPDYQPYPYDPEQAQALLAEAGYADGFATQLFYNTEGPYWVAIAPIVQQQLAQIGVDLELVPLSHSAFIAQVNTPEAVPIGFQSWAAVFPDPNDMIGPQFTCDARGVTGANNSYYCSEELERLLAEAEAETDLTRRAELYVQMNQMIMDDAPHVPLWAPEIHMLLHSRVRDYDFHPAMYAADAYLWIDQSGQ
jgi:ABC-type transport system substrate-binding protein